MVDVECRKHVKYIYIYIYICFTCFIDSTSINVKLGFSFLRNLLSPVWRTHERNISITKVYGLSAPYFSIQLLIVIIIITVKYLSFALYLILFS